ncbi:RNA-binding domain-containing protein [Aspergillus steynii IBT 23096]|uniref:RNA-binding domain-containing protein n=1 Tax=Aspergillus steynii IBT 23096 TaxID=1392250 RepID=A0A2I2GCY3_9EURO|nr:RNA-binding domain-containing protein [Aspergillus steynii IBT 23096]PLB50707.1 RNA-binding domain-containing protein [Aspergillus steynii IBT 23096]
MHHFHRAATRLISSAASAPARSSWAFAPRSSPSVFLPRLSQPLSQYRWNSNNAPSQPEPPKQEAVEEQHNSNEQLIDATLQYVEGSSEKTGEIATEAEHLAAQKKPDLPIPESNRDSVKEHRHQKLKARATGTLEPKETVFVGNLFYDVTASDLRKQMEKYGVVERLQIVHDDRGFSRGYGYVMYDTIESARRAIDAMNWRVYEGRYVVVQFAQTNMHQFSKLRPVSRTLYIGNMAFEMTDRDLNELFKDIVNVMDIRVSIDRRTGKPRGFAHAEFTDTQASRKALEILSKKAPYGRKLHVNYADDGRSVTSGGPGNRE